MTRSLGRRLADAVAGTALAERIDAAAAPFVEQRNSDTAASRLDGANLVGLSRMLAVRSDVAGFLAYRPTLFERIVDAHAGSLRERAQQLENARAPEPDSDLETALDDLRILRREETSFASCLDLGGVVSFPEVSTFLSVLAESITRRALALAERSGAKAGTTPALSVIGMGKIAGREFTYYSDLDLIFLYDGGPDGIEAASRLGQRLTSYLSTTTGAGVAYAVDTRLRPSGKQGMLVTSLEAYERYQTEKAETWEHLAVLKARPIAGDVARATSVLDRVHARVLSQPGNPWPYLADMRRRVESERIRDAAEPEVPFKAGAGGLMDVDFLAGGGLLERGPGDVPAFPNAAEMLRCTLRGPRREALIEDHRLLRVVEARARWCAGRAVESLSTASATLEAVSALMDPEQTGDALLERIAVARARVRSCYEAVVEAGTIAALAG